MPAHDEPDGYEGGVTFSVDGEETRTAHAALAARFEPLAGRVVWSGRIAADLPPRAQVVVTTPHGSARAETTERDVWGNTRITGVDRPPFPVELLDEPANRCRRGGDPAGPRGATRDSSPGPSSPMSRARRGSES